MGNSRVGRRRFTCPAGARAISQRGRRAPHLGYDAGHGMAALTGVRWGHPGNSLLKKDLLLFDKIAWVTSGDDRGTVEWLRERGLLLERVGYVTPTTPTDELAPEWTDALEVERQAWEKIVQHSRHRRVVLGPNLEQFSPPPEVTKLVDAIVRVSALHLRQRMELNAVPIAYQWGPLLCHSTVSAQAIRVVLNELPFPNECCSLEDILAFRESARSQGLVQDLRKWLNEMASGALSPIEISDILEHLVARYQRTFALEKERLTTGMLETIVITTAEIAECLVKFRWSRLAKKLFEVRHNQIDLMRAELALPGREVAYIVKARERFGK